MLTRYEKIMLWVMGLIEYLDTKFIKFFPSIGGFLFCLFVWGIVGGLDRRTFKAEHTPIVFCILLAFAFLALLWRHENKKEKERNKKRRSKNDKRRIYKNT